eukprot:422574-Prorocentrum_minimum.AAC.2
MPAAFAPSLRELTKCTENARLGRPPSKRTHQMYRKWPPRIAPSLGELTKCTENGRRVRPLSRRNSPNVPKMAAAVRPLSNRTHQMYRKWPPRIAPSLRELTKCTENGRRGTPPKRTHQMYRKWPLRSPRYIYATDIEPSDSKPVS